MVLYHGGTPLVNTRQGNWCILCLFSRILGVVKNGIYFFDWTLRLIIFVEVDHHFIEFCWIIHKASFSQVKVTLWIIWNLVLICFGRFKSEHVAAHFHHYNNGISWPHDSIEIIKIFWVEWASQFVCFFKNSVSFLHVARKLSKRRKISTSCFSSRILGGLGSFRGWDAGSLRFH